MARASHLWGLVGGFTFGAVAWLALFAAQFGVPTWNARWATSLYAQKEAMAKVPGPPRVVIVGGSSPLFGVRASQLSSALGVPVLNFGTHAGLDLAYILERAEAVIRQGDTVVLALEYDYYRRTPQWMDPFMLDHAVASDTAYFHRLPAIRKVGAILQMDMIRVVGPWRERGDPRLPGAYEPYGNEVLDEHGDLLANNPVLKTDATRKRLGSQQRLGIGTDEGTLEVIDRFVRRCRDKGVAILAVPPALMGEAILRTPQFQAMLATIERWHGEIGIPYLLPPQEAIYPQAWFFDTRYHADGSAARFHTARLVRALRSHVPAQRAPVATPEKPRHALAQLDAAFAGWEPLSGFGAVEGPYPHWGLGAVIWALGERSSIAVRALEPGPVQVRGSMRAAAPGQRLEVRAAGRRLYEKVFTQAGEFEDVAFTFEAGAGDAQIQLVHSGNPRPAAGPHYALLVRNLRFERVP